jgi:hypothetical protein
VGKLCFDSICRLLNLDVAEYDVLTGVRETRIVDSSEKMGRTGSEAKGLTISKIPLVETAYRI